MPKTTLKPVSVYMTEEQFAVIEKLALFANRSISNLLLTLGLEKADAEGLLSSWKSKSSTRYVQPKQKRRTG